MSAIVDGVGEIMAKGLANYDWDRLNEAGKQRYRNVAEMIIVFVVDMEEQDMEQR